MDARHTRRHVLLPVVAVVLAFMGSIAVPTPSWADEPARSPAPAQAGPAAQAMDALAVEAHAEGSVRVLVELAADFVPEGELDERGRATQRAAFGRQRAALARELRGTGHAVLREYDSVPTVAMEATPAAIEVLRASASVTGVVVDERVELALAQSTEYIEAPDLWSRSAPGTAGAGYAVAVLDTGVDGSHPGFGGRIVAEACFSNTGGNTDARSLCPNGQDRQVGPGAGVHCTVSSTCSHGTHVAGIVAGVAPGVDIMPVQVFSASDCGVGGLSTCLSSFRSDLLAGLEHVLEASRTRQVAAANLSLGGSQPYQGFCDGDTTFKAMVDNLRSEGVATVIASGNAGWTDAVSHPACVSTAVAVGSTAVSNDQVSSFSNNHPEVLDLLAPGEVIESAVPGGGTAKMKGTSMAAPHVAGAWALLRHQLPEASVTTILDRLRTAGIAVEDTRGSQAYAHPRLRLSTQALGLDEPAPAPAPEPDPTTEPSPQPEPEPSPEPAPDEPQCGASFSDVGVAHPFCAEIDWMARQHISVGYKDGTFRPGEPVTRQAVAAFLHKLAGQPAVTLDSAPFDDVSVDHPFAEAITWMVEQQIAAGYPDNTFRPGADVTRQAVAAFLHRYAGEPSVSTTGPRFSDVHSGHPFHEAITWMSEQQLSTGYSDGTFRPGRDVTRQAVASFLFRYATR